MILPPPPGLRLGLCCQFVEQPVKFPTTTATALAKLPRDGQLRRLAALCQANAEALLTALKWCASEGVGSFRVNSQILPLKTHPELGYSLDQLPGGSQIRQGFLACGEFARRHQLRLSFHPDQFVLLNSPNPRAHANALAELDYQAEVAAWIGADTINIHGGGAYGDKSAALALLRRNIELLPEAVRCRLTLENDDKIFTPADLLPVCRATAVPLVYDVHHHRCLPDGQSIAAVTEQARQTWRGEPLFHISSPLEGWNGAKPERHHDYIDIADFPPQWLGWPLTVEVEAKAKELAIARLSRQLPSLAPAS